MKKNRDEMYNLFTKEVQNLGYFLIDLKINTTVKSINVEAFIYKKEGVNLDDCEAVHKAIYTKLQIELNNKNLFLQVSSPGLTRELSYFDEFELFKDKKVKINLIDNLEVKMGIIKNADLENEILTLETDLPSNETIDMNNIKKAKLVF